MEAAGLHSPPGRIDRIGSDLTGGLLEYFTPLPLPVLLRACSSVEEFVCEENETHAYAPYIFIGCISIRNGAVSPNMAALHFDGMSGNLNLNSIASLISIAKRIDSRVTGLRSEIVFADSPIPSSARIIFSHPENVMGLLRSCISEECAECDSPPYVAACVTGFFLAYLHPFHDCNGRWMRVLLTAGFGGSKPSLDSAICSLFLYDWKSLLTQVIWRSSMRNGLAEYIDIALHFKKHMKNMGEDVISSAQELDLLALKLIPEDKTRMLALKKFYCEGGVKGGDFKAKYRECVEEFISSASREIPLFSGNNSINCDRAWRMLKMVSKKFTSKHMPMECAR